MTMIIPITMALIGLIVGGPIGALLAVLIWALYVIFHMHTSKKK